MIPSFFYLIMCPQLEDPLFPFVTQKASMNLLSVDHRFIFIILLIYYQSEITKQATKPQNTSTSIKLILEQHF